ncbi:unnamed protein product [Dibothriocephalus latus]|uniref:Uncharacterized protein n=1 Tax=Dibothriocephalus latus TaxID=60516 RepID=A0A3P6SZL0_DIBLA|nr:unnamed protein product [Dibothriocephalus latus]
MGSSSILILKPYDGTKKTAIRGCWIELSENKKTINFPNFFAFPSDFHKKPLRWYEFLLLGNSRQQACKICLSTFGSTSNGQVSSEMMSNFILALEGMDASTEPEVPSSGVLVASKIVFIDSCSPVVEWENTPKDEVNEVYLQQFAIEEIVFGYTEELHFDRCV